MEKPREFNESEFKRQWSVRGVGMGMHHGELHGARCYHEWIVKPKIDELEAKLKIAVEILSSCTDDDCRGPGSSYACPGCKARDILEGTSAVRVQPTKNEWHEAIKKLCDWIAKEGHLEYGPCVAIYNTLGDFLRADNKKLQHQGLSTAEE